MKRFFGLIFIFLISFLFPIQVFAVDFSINETEITAQLKGNGDVQVVESHTYEFDGEFNGITRSILPKQGTSIKDFKATENGSALQMEQEEDLYKIYRSGEDEVITIQLSYLIQDGVEVYSDMGQFYWPFFDSSNESDYENLTITVQPPHQTDDVIAYGFDEAEGTAQILDNGAAVFHLGEVESGKNGDIRVAYDRALFPSANVNPNTIREELEAEHQALIKKQEAYDQRRELLQSIAPYIVFVFGITLILLIFFAWSKQRQTALEAEREYSSTSLTPKEIMSMPATIYYFRNFMIGHTEMLTVGLMDLLRKGYITQKNKDEYLLLHRKTDHDHEAHLIRLLFDEIGENKTFEFKQLETYIANGRNQENFQKQIHTWLNLILNETKSHRLFDKHKNLRWTIGIMSILFIPLSIIYGIHHLWIYLLLFIVLMGGFLLFAILFQPRTIKGHILKKQWKQLKEKLHDLPLDQWNLLPEDDKERAFIFSVGLNDQKLKDKNKTLIEKFSQSTEDINANHTLNMLLLLAFYSTANSSFSSATVASASSPSTTTTIGTGVGGGGGGSGAF